MGKAARFLACGLWLAAAAAAQPAMAEWRRAESPHFVVYSEGREKPLRDYVNKLEVFDGLLRREHAVGPAEGQGQKLTIYLVDDLAGMRRVSPGVSRNVGGFYGAGTQDVYAVAQREGEHTLLHEYVHHFMLQHRPYAYPAWLVEGVAEYWAPTDIANDAVVVGKFSEGRTRDLVGQPWIELQDLLRKRPMEFRHREEQAMFYAQAWLLTHYLARDEARRPQLRAYMKAVGETGADPARAMETATGMSLRDLTTTLQAYLRGRIVSERFAVKGGRLPQAPMTVTVLPASADALLLENQALKRKLEPEEAKALLAKVRMEAPRHGNDRLARITLARAELAHGDRAKGEALLEAQLAASPDDAEALTMLGVSLMDAGDAAPDRRAALYAQAEARLRTALKAEPKRYQTLYALARSRSVKPGYPTERDLETLLAAHELAPQVSGIRLRAAEALATRGRWDWVRSLMGPLINNPHGGEDSAAARALLAKAPAASGAVQP
jgi:tetratricopeptide (TPR) repeat protein